MEHTVNHRSGTESVSYSLLTMVGMIASALYSVVDAYFVAGLGDSQMGAISIVFPIVQLMIGLGMTFGSGAGSYISRLLGKGEIEQANRTASTALFSAIGAGTMAVVASLLFLNGFLTALGATDTMLPMRVNMPSFIFREPFLISSMCA